MLNERTAAPAAVSPPAEPASPSPSQSLRKLADFLDGVPGLPPLYISLWSHYRQADLQVSRSEKDTRERCLAVARVARALGVDTHLTRFRDEMDFEAHGTVDDLAIHIYAPSVVAAVPADEVKQECA
ncbi:hypothetical protein AB0I54_00195 [Streptomyces sp. NPDC050625]|uniref:hypothetical protein n=1 Tax=Streptomyces sp. NPDC050625 TaxID=3154629 RepID=UPI00341FE72B